MCITIEKKNSTEIRLLNHNTTFLFEFHLNALEYFDKCMKNVTKIMTNRLPNRNKQRKLPFNNKILIFLVIPLLRRMLNYE